MLWIRKKVCALDIENYLKSIQQETGVEPSRYVYTLLLKDFHAKNQFQKIPDTCDNKLLVEVLSVLKKFDKHKII